jgi:hypothetical protein
MSASDRKAPRNECREIPGSPPLNWKDRGDGRYDALASRKVGGKYFIEWVERHYSNDSCEWWECRYYEVHYQPKGAGGIGNIHQSTISTLAKAKALAELDHQKRKEMVDKYGERFPEEAWWQFGREMREAQTGPYKAFIDTPDPEPTAAHSDQGRAG